MKLNQSISLWGGGPGSGCRGPSCGRPLSAIPNPPKTDIPLGKTTEDVWKDSKTGEWSKDRERWHQAMAVKAIAGKTAPIGRKPIAIIMGGGTASGKSTLSNKLIGEQPNYVRIDADVLKPTIPEFDQLRAQEGNQESETRSRNPNLATTRVHEESSYLAKLILAKAAARGLDVIYDATSSGKGMPLMINKLKSEGYAVHMLFADVPEAIAAERAKQRAADPSDPAGYGRHIPLDALHNTHVMSAANFMMMKDSNLLSSSKLYDTTGDSPKLVYSGGKGEKGKVHDAKVWEYYTKKAAGN